MSSESSDNGKDLDPKNEALRKEVEAQFDNDPILKAKISELMKKPLDRIQAGFLFEPVGAEALQKLRQCLCGTKISGHYQGWEHFGILLGLDQLQIQCIKNGFMMHQMDEDPTSYTLKAFAQNSDATLDKIISTLQKMKRHDIVNLVADLFMELTDKVVIEVQRTFDSDYDSFSSIQHDMLDQDQSCKNIIIPPSFPLKVPFVLQELKRPTRTAEPTLSPFVRNFSTKVECHQNHDTTRQLAPHRQTKYGKKVMLTFSSDGLQVAKDVARILREEIYCDQRIGVVILNDHISFVNSNPEQFILSCLEQVDYVIPIITTEYLQEVYSHSSNLRHAQQSSLLDLDPKYVKYVYTLMNNIFSLDGCINEKVRCVVPDKLLHLTHEVRDPLFRAWVKQSETKELGQRMLKAAL